jgi:hypothetical protein
MVARRPIAAIRERMAARLNPRWKPEPLPPVDPEVVASVLASCQAGVPLDAFNPAVPSRRC